jgi:1,4-alpha-glucan branching enzyme
MDTNEYMIHNLLKQFASGEAPRAYSFMGCHRQKRDGREGYVFRVWAPCAQGVSVGLVKSGITADVTPETAVSVSVLLRDE